MKTLKHLRTLYLCVLLSCYSFYMTAATIYVNHAASGLNDGTSWTNAYVDLQDAFANATSGDDIWVAQGTYYPVSGTSSSGATNAERLIYFDWVSGVDVYGGFVGNESVLSARDVVNNVTILSGEIGAPTINDNSINIIFADAGVSNDRLDGFTITRGNAIHDFPGGRADKAGGALWNKNSSLIVANCIFEDNQALAGGALYLLNSTSSFTDCQFINNRSDTLSSGSQGSGGAALIVSATQNKQTFTRCIFNGNQAEKRGGAIIITGISEPFLYYCLFINNSAVQEGGALSARDDSDFLGANNTFSNNSSSSGAVSGIATTSLALDYSIFWNNIGGSNDLTGAGISGIYNLIELPATVFGPGTGNLNVDPLFVDPSNDDYRLSICSPAIDATNLTTSLSSPLDLDNNPYPFTGTLGDMGAYEYQGDLSDQDGDGFTVCNGDCDDTNGAVNPNATEICDGIDNDCDGLVDDNDPDITGQNTYYADADSDGFGDPNSPIISCNQPPNTVTNSDDCDDTNGAVNPNATEICDGIDNDCDGLVDDNDPDITGQNTYYADADSDGFGDPNSPIISCSQPPNTVTNSDDCDDSNGAVNPNATEICDGIDNDCDGLVDDNDPDITGQNTYYADADSDGFGDLNTPIISCSQPPNTVTNSDDCDDSNGAVNPNATEICDGIDNDCDGLVDDNDPDITGQNTYYADADSDGFGDPNSPVISCNQPPNTVTNSDDCDDTNGAVNPNATEICDGIDNDCDGLVDDNDPDITGQNTYYADADSDGFGDPNSPIISCSQPPNTVTNSDDCDDSNGAVNPNATEICDGIDNDCDGLVDDNDLDITGQNTYYADADSDGFGDPNSPIISCSQPPNTVTNSDDCDDSNGAVNPNATEICDGIDNDCDGLVDDNDPDITGQNTYYADADSDGFGDLNTPIISCSQPPNTVTNSDDCDDSNGAVNPNATEICDGIDNDCDGLVDDNDPDITGQNTYYADADSDGFGDLNTPIISCSQPPNTVTNSDDCDDSNGAVNPNATEICDGIDNDCDGLVDDNDPDITGQNTYYADADSDGFGDPNSPVISCNQPPNTVTNSDDCDDTNGAVNPNATEICDGIDNDCDGLVDDNDPDITGQNTYYADADSDGFGDPNSPIISCSQPPNTVTNSDDCDDSNGAVNPNATEICDGIDNDCDGLVDDNDPDITGQNTYYADADSDGFGDPNSAIISCSQPPNTVTNSDDCDDSNGAVNPNATEICDGIDNDCDGLVDDNDPDITGQNTYYADADSDGFGDPNSPIISCSQPPNTVTNSDDCDDTNGAVNPNATEICDGIDNDCDGLVDDNDPDITGQNTYYADADSDGFGDPNSPIISCSQPPNTVTNSDDCDDSNGAVNPNATEICDGIDNDCDGLVDDNDPSSIDPCIVPCVFETINFEDFEHGLGIWHLGGHDAFRKWDLHYPQSGHYAVQLRDNSGGSSSIFTEDIDLSGKTKVRVSFYYKTWSFEHGEDFFLEYSADGGAHYQILDTWTKDGANGAFSIVNGHRENESIIYENITLTTHSRFRFRSDASNNFDKVWIDDIKIEACGGNAIVCNGTINGIQLNPQGGAPLIDLTDGQVFCASDFGQHIRIRALAGGTHESLLFSITTPSGLVSNIENHVNYDSHEFSPEVGTYIVHAQLYSAADQGGTLCDETTLTFEIEPSSVCNPGGDCFTVYDHEDFEHGWGLWNDGGYDAYRNYEPGSGANGSNYCIRLRDNSGYASSMFTDILDFSNVSEVKIDFDYMAQSMEHGEDFFLKYSNDRGHTWHVVRNWKSGTDFQNDILYHESIAFTGNFTAHTKFKIKCDASSNADKIFIDDVTISICGTASIQSEENEATTMSRSQNVEIHVKDILITPNPVNNMLKIEGLEANTTYDVFSIHGALILSKKEQSHLDVSNLIQGTYFIKTSNGQITRFIKS